MTLMIISTDTPEKVKIEYEDGSTKIISAETYGIVKTIIEAKTIEHIPSPFDNPENNLQLYSGSIS
jgi:hypothetical protein